MTLINYLACDWCETKIYHFDDHAEIRFVLHGKPVMDHGIQHMCGICSEHLQEILRDEMAPEKENG